MHLTLSWAILPVRGVTIQKSGCDSFLRMWLSYSSSQNTDSLDSNKRKMWLACWEPWPCSTGQGGGINPHFFLLGRITFQLLKWLLHPCSTPGTSTHTESIVEHLANWMQRLWLLLNYFILYLVTTWCNLLKKKFRESSWFHRRQRGISTGT